MSQLVWMYSVIPYSVIAWVLNIAIIIGIIAILCSYFVKEIPYIKIYRFPIQVLGILILIVSIYFKGLTSADNSWKDKMADLQQQMADAQKLVEEKNKLLEQKVTTKIEHVKEVQYKTKVVIKEVSKKIDAKCTVAPEAIGVLNSAAKGEVPNIPQDTK